MSKWDGWGKWNKLFVSGQRLFCGCWCVMCDWWHDDDLYKGTNRKKMFLFLLLATWPGRSFHVYMIKTLSFDWWLNWKKHKSFAKNMPSFHWLLFTLSRYLLATLPTETSMQNALCFHSPLTLYKNLLTTLPTEVLLESMLSFHRSFSLQSSENLFKNIKCFHSPLTLF